MSEQNATVPLNRSQRDELAARLRDMWRRIEEADASSEELRKVGFVMGDLRMIREAAAALAPSAVGGAEPQLAEVLRTLTLPSAAGGVTRPSEREQFAYAEGWRAGAEQPCTPTREQVEAVLIRLVSNAARDKALWPDELDQAIYDLNALYTRTPGDRG
jgi:hypothetical protein